MTIKSFDAEVTLVDGTPVINNDKPVILRDIIADMLCGNYQDEANSLSGVEKFKRGTLALKIKAGGDIDFKTEELADIKEIVGKRGTVPMVYQTFNILDGE